MMRAANAPPRILKWREFNHMCEWMSDNSELTGAHLPAAVKEELPFCVQVQTLTPVREICYYCYFYFLGLIRRLPSFGRFARPSGGASPAPCPRTTSELSRLVRRRPRSPPQNSNTDCC